MPAAASKSAASGGSPVMALRGIMVGGAGNPDTLGLTESERTRKLLQILQHVGELCRFRTPVHTSFPVLFDDGGGGGTDETFAGEFGFHFRNFGTHFFKFFGQAGALGFDVDEAFEGEINFT